jgi:RNA polymerase sigma-70 factor (ECF subfamily)
MFADHQSHCASGAEQWDEMVQIAVDKSRLAELFDESRLRLKRIVTASMDHRVRARVDASDVLQETFVEATERIDAYMSAPKVSVFVWLRFLAKQQLAKMHRRHLGAQIRDASRDRSMDWNGDSRESAVALAAQLVTGLTTASAILQRKELRTEVRQGLDRLDDRSREILLLRHFEQLSNNEAADVLQISATAACNRYIRALDRLKLQLNCDQSNDR